MEKTKLTPEQKKELRKLRKKELQKKTLAKAVALKSEYKNQVSKAMITAFGLIIALLWKDFINLLMPTITTPGFIESYPLLVSFYTAFIVTVIAVLGIVLVTDWSKKDKKNV